MICRVCGSRVDESDGGVGRYVEQGWNYTDLYAVGIVATDWICPECIAAFKKTAQIRRSKVNEHKHYESDEPGDDVAATAVQQALAAESHIWSPRRQHP